VFNDVINYLIVEIHSCCCWLLRVAYIIVWCYLVYSRLSWSALLLYVCNVFIAVLRDFCWSLLYFLHFSAK